MCLFSTPDAIKIMQMRGYLLHENRLRYLIRAGHFVPPEGRLGSRWAWSQDDLDRLRRFLMAESRQAGGRS